MYPLPLGIGFMPPLWTSGCEGLIDATSNVSRVGLSWAIAKGDNINPTAATNVHDLRIILEPSQLGV
jgi:hypothetical protein